MGFVRSSIAFVRCMAIWIGAETACFMARFKGPDTGTGRREFKRVLLVVPFPPPINGGVYRPISWTKYGPECGWKPDVLTYGNDDSPGQADRVLLSEVPNQACVMRHNPDARLPWPIARRTGVGGDFDDSLAWQRAVVSSKKQAEYDAVVASGPPFSTFVAAFYIARRFNKPLVLDYRDEWSENPFPFVVKTSFGHWWEKRCLRHADRVIYTTRSQMEHAARVFGETIRGKAVVIPNGWDEKHRSAQPRPDVDGSSKDVDILFAGAIGTHTPFQIFLDAFSEFCEDNSDIASDICLSILGDQSPDAMEQIRSSDLRDRLSFEPQLPVTEVIDRLNRSRIALIITSPEFERYIPGKLYYYMACARPILVYGTRGEAQRIVEATGAGVFVPESDKAAFSDTVRAFAADSGEKWNTESRKNWCMEHTRGKSAQALYSVLDELVSENS